MFGYDGSSRVPLRNTCIRQVDRQGMNVAWQHTIVIGLTVSGLPRNKHPRIGDVLQPRFRVRYDEDPPKPAAKADDVDASDACTCRHFAG